MSPHFTREELECRHCGELPEAYGKALAASLEEFRALYGRPVRLSSAYRCMEHPREQGKAENATHAHVRHLAADIICSGAEAQAVIQVALSLGFTGIGVSQKGAMGSRFIHVDKRPTRALWSY